jgi:HAD superfamily hydrolase (TIGR01549 family)
MTYLAVFDWNGTLYDDSDIVMAAQNAVLERFGASGCITRTAMEAYDHFPLATYFQRFGLSEDVFLARSEEVFACFWETYNKWENEKGISLRQGVIQVLGRLHQKGVSLAVLSNKGHDPLVQKLKELGLIDYFTEVNGIPCQSSTIQKLSKPARLQDMVTRLGVDPARCVMVGDSTEDILAGRQIGALGIGITGGVGGKDLLQSAEPHSLISHFSELPHVLNAHWQDCRLAL